MIPTPRPTPPPRTLNPEGAPRRIGVELEFAAVSAGEGARLVAGLFGGRVVEEDPHRFRIIDSRLGDFTAELDSQYVHRAEGDAETAPDDPLEALLDGFQDRLRAFFGDLGSAVIPCEVVCPPVPLASLPDLEELVGALVKAGAEGTRAHPFHAFGAQLNLEIAEGGTPWIVDVLKAYLLLSDWLRAIIDVDLTRRLVAFADPFPRDYVARVVDPAYRPDLSTLIDDYLAANPTRDRELDMLPLFTWLDEGRVRARIDDPRVKARPALHYRLPDANLGQPGWSLTLEWSRWAVVERLAARRSVLEAMGQAWLEHRNRRLPGGLANDWALKASEWLVLA
ncbi:amidoligase family protein [Roseospirillum parvum]|uniref:Putative amidoligase enzyme n=1 Tax=Roseospirillum parvum TaxID=83401 RepID=A0A1G7Z8L0_9PROT|nr:amidoligase family protein [Roseospirillum parvum]SDH04460.1 Putative amidoligase enzyme [Roseospirillum parvum]